jgi:hypothetical protein
MTYLCVAQINQVPVWLHHGLSIQSQRRWRRRARHPVPVSRAPLFSEQIIDVKGAADERLLSLPFLPTRPRRQDDLVVVIIKVVESRILVFIVLLMQNSSNLKFQKKHMCILN